MIENALLAVIQGLTEFLPVSSSGHLTIFQALFGMKDPNANLTLDIILHSGTLLAVLAYFKDDLFPYFTLKGWRDKRLRRIVYLIIAASIPTGIIGLSFKDFFENLFASPDMVCMMLLVTAALLYLADKKANKAHETLSKSGDLADISFRDALIIGLMQGIAIIPGISRSGSTISIAMLLGIAGPTAAHFSFLLMIPSVGGATLLEARKLFKSGMPTTLTLGDAVCSAFISCIVGLLTLKLLMYMLHNQNLRYFAYYLIVFSTTAFILLHTIGTVL